MKIVIGLHKVTKENMNEPVELLKEIEKLVQKYNIVRDLDMK